MKICKWEYNEWDECWYTQCKNAFSLENGTPKDNNMKYCPYCGNLIQQELQE